MGGRTMEPFNPGLGRTISIAATAVSASTTVLTTTPGSVAGQVLVTNAGATLAFIRMSRASDTTAATVADTPILPNDRFVLSSGAIVGENMLISAICPGGTTTLYFTAGFGI